VERPDIEDSKCIEDVTCSVRLKVPSRSSGHTYMEVYDDNKEERTNMNATPIKVEIPQIGSNSNITMATAGRGNSHNRFGLLP
jgi:hypothetical protein